MRLTTGQRVPDFEVKSLSGKVVSSDELKGQRYMLSFYRYASCPFCNLRVSFLMGLHEELGLDNQFIGIFQSDEKDMQEHVANQSPPFPLVSDAKQILYKRFGVEAGVWGYFKGAMKVKTLLKAFQSGFFIKNSMGPKTTIPADFLIDEEGIIQYAYYGKDISDHLNLEVVTRFFEV